MPRLSSALDSAAARGEKAMGMFLTSGFPDPPSTLPLLHAIEEGGVDFIELGMPFSDPLGEGLPIQRSSERALRHGIRMRDTLRTAEAFRSRSDTPLLLMGYVNPIYRYGTGNFCRDARSSGVDGLILPDLPLEESDAVFEAAGVAGLDLVHLIAPNTPNDRIEEIDERSRGFVYAVSVTGLTGARLDANDGVLDYLERARRHVRRNKLVVGFGIRTHADAARLSRHTDGFVVGSALVDEVERLWDGTTSSMQERLEHVQSFVRSLKFGPVPDQVAG